MAMAKAGLENNIAKQLVLDGHKLLWHQDKVNAWLSGERIAPITIDCALTRRCTYRCRYCYGQLQLTPRRIGTAGVPLSAENDEKAMTKDVIFEFLDDAAEIKVKAISFVSDGESTCSPYLYDAIARARENGLDVALGTNGYLLDEGRLDEILPRLTYIRFNISAADPQPYSQIMGCKEECFTKVLRTIKECVRFKKENNLSVTIGIQMVLMPQFSAQIIPFAKLGKDLGVDYAVIKHCSDDEQGSLGIDYARYFSLIDTLKAAEGYSTPGYLVKVKWSKMLSKGTRRYRRCFGPPFMLQVSGSGLVAPCGMFFHEKYKKYHIGNIAETSFKKIWQSERYWEIMNLLASDAFDAQTMCGTLCLQEKVNEFLWELKNGEASLGIPSGEKPVHSNFV